MVFFELFAGQLAMLKNEQNIVDAETPLTHPQLDMSALDQIAPAGSIPSKDSLPFRG
ncbi:MAG: hypothetical protein U5J62_02770 [Desulfurivibrio sp.]|nr:hypothetical protein [Desulfurivibrio sp.]